MSHRYNGNTIGNYRRMFIKTPSMLSSIDQAIPIWDLIGISESEYQIRFSTPITIPIQKEEVIDEVIAEIIEKIIEEHKQTRMIEEIRQIENE